MPGYNAQTYLQGFISAANIREQNRTSSDNIPDTEVFNRINDALGYCATQYKPVKLRRTADIVDGEQVVQFPAARLNMSITELLVIETDNRQYPLERITEDEMERIYPVADTSRDSGKPRYWCFASNQLSQATLNSIRIRPVPRWSKTDGVVFRYPSFPNQIERIENTATRLVDITTQTQYAYVYGTGGGTGASICRFGDEIGVCATTNTDGTTVSDPTVRVWYSIIESNIPDGTLTDLITNGTFTGAATGWTLGGGAAYNSNNVTFTGAGTLSQTMTGADDTRFYRVEFTLSGASSPSLTVSYNGTVVSSSAYTTDGAKYLYFESDVDDGVLLFTNASGNVTIDTVTCTAVSRFTLDRLYNQATATAARYIGAQVPDIEYSVPAGVGYAPVHWALAEYFDDMQQPAKSDRYRKKALERIALFNQDEVNDQDNRYNPYLGTDRMVENMTVTYWDPQYGGGYVSYNERGIGEGWVQSY
jgi:hypothetical protein